MSEPVHTGSKYVRTIHSCVGGPSTKVDVYDVLEAFGDPPAPVGHAVKKLLCCGIRGKGDELQDLVEARDAINRMIDRVKRKQSDKPSPPSATNHAATGFVFDVKTFPEQTADLAQVGNVAVNSKGEISQTAASVMIDETVSHDHDKGGTLASTIGPTDAGHHFLVQDNRWANRRCCRCDLTVADYIARGAPTCSPTKPGYLWPGGRG